MSRKRAFDFDQLKIFFENCKAIRVSLWLVYKTTSLDKISILP